MLSERQRRILYRASRRSKLEAEELLRPFAERVSPEMSEEELVGFELLLELDDISILEIFAGKKPAPEGLEGAFGKLREFWRGSK
ncbi:MAG: succinate dehydrogenase assembly factor 2 [candidate division WOR-3 bacterium]